MTPSVTLQWAFRFKNKVTQSKQSGCDTKRELSYLQAVGGCSGLEVWGYVPPEVAACHAAESGEEKVKHNITCIDSSQCTLAGDATLRWLIIPGLEKAMMRKEWHMANSYMTDSNLAPSPTMVSTRRHNDPRPEGPPSQPAAFTLA